MKNVINIRNVFFVYTIDQSTIIIDHFLLFIIYRIYIIYYIYIYIYIYIHVYIEYKFNVTLSDFVNIRNA